MVYRRTAWRNYKMAVYLLSRAKLDMVEKHREDVLRFARAVRNDVGTTLAQYMSATAAIIHHGTIYNKSKGTTK